MNTNFIFIPTDDQHTFGRRGQWMCVYCCRFVEFSALGFSTHVKFCKPYLELNSSVVQQKKEMPFTPIQLFQ